MRKFSRFVIALMLLVIAIPSLAAEKGTGPLFDYVAKADDSYQWTKKQEGKVGGVTFTELILTSQTWKGIVWKHQLFICMPQEIDDASQALLFINGGSWNDSLEKPTKGKIRLPSEAAIIAQIVRQTKAPIVLLSHVPQQPIFDGKKEDAAISYTFDQFLKTGDPEWPLLLPMTKSAVRAMDAVQEFAKQQWQMDIDNFTVTGGSKRGWTTYLTGAVDPRVNAIAPIVIDVLNMPKQMKHQLAAWGDYSAMIKDYTENGIQSHADTPQGKALNAIVDPYSYLEQLTQPKLLIIGTNDPYWPLDALNIYWDDLLGEKHILYIPNNGHGVNDFRRLLGSIGALHKQAAGQITLPKLSWDLQESDDKLVLSFKSDQLPKKVSAWIASSPTRDFRQAKWTDTTLEEVDGVYRHELPVSSDKFVAMFGEGQFDADGLTCYLSTNVKIAGGSAVESK